MGNGETWLVLLTLNRTLLSLNVVDSLTVYWHCLSLAFYIMRYLAKLFDHFLEKGSVKGHVS